MKYDVNCSKTWSGLSFPNLLSTRKICNHFFHQSSMRNFYIRKVHAGGEWLERDSVRDALDLMLQHGAQAAISEKLSLKELELARMVADGDSNKVIARKIESTEGAVKATLHRIYQKFEVRGRVDLARLVRERGL